MRAFRAALGVLALGVLCALAWRFSGALRAPHVEGPPSARVVGVGLGLFASDAMYDYAALLDEVVQVGATDVLLVVPWYQRDVGAHDMAPRPGFTPAHVTVQRTIRQAKTRGLRVGVMPIVRLVHRGGGAWRGQIRPAAGHAAWFAAYRRRLLPLAALCAAEGVARFGVGSELLSLERHQHAWRALIRDVRDVYPGSLFYSANWDHVQPVRFWDALDEIGVTAYHELARTGESPSDDVMTRRLTRALEGLGQVRAAHGKPVLLTEIGYPSRSSAANAPWNETSAAPIDLALQARLYDVSCDALSRSPHIAGQYYWNWFGFGGPTDGEYTPRGKPAAGALRACLRRQRAQNRDPAVGEAARVRQRTSHDAGSP